MPSSMQQQLQPRKRLHHISSSYQNYFDSWLFFVAVVVGSDFIPLIDVIKFLIFCLSSRTDFSSLLLSLRNSDFVPLIDVIKFLMFCLSSRTWCSNQNLFVTWTRSIRWFPHVLGKLENISKSCKITSTSYWLLFDAIRDVEIHLDEQRLIRKKFHVIRKHFSSLHLLIGTPAQPYKRCDDVIMFK